MEQLREIRKQEIFCCEIDNLTAHAAQAAFTFTEEAHWLSLRYVEIYLANGNKKIMHVQEAGRHGETVGC